MDGVGPGPDCNYASQEEQAHAPMGTLRILLDPAPCQPTLFRGAGTKTEERTRKWMATGLGTRHANITSIVLV